MRAKAITALCGVLAVVPIAAGSCDGGPGARPGDAGPEQLDASADTAPSCPAAAVDAEVGACRATLPAPPTGCASTWAEHKRRGCAPGVVVFVSADTPAIRQWIWFERPWLSGGQSCFFDSESGALAGIWEVKDQPYFCCGTSFDVTYGDVDHDLHDAASRAASPWVGKLYDMDGTAAVEGGEVRYCASE